MGKYFISIIAIGFFVISCSHGITQHFPTGENLINPAEIILIRNKNIFCGGQSATILLDGVAIGYLRTGEYVNFWVESGEHSIVATPLIGSARKFSDNFEAGKKNYLLISLTDFFDFSPKRSGFADLLFFALTGMVSGSGSGCDFEVESISEEKGIKRIRESKNLINMHNKNKSATKTESVKEGSKGILNSLNPEEPWAGVWSLKYNYGEGYVLVLKQDGQKVRSAENSSIKFKGRVEGDDLDGWIELDKQRSLRLKISPDYKSFSGNFMQSMSVVTGQIWGKRKE